MGLLDDAIREHLDLKRQHGAAEDELARQEAEALGPVTEEDIYAPSAEIDVDEPQLEREAGWPFDRVAEDELEDEPDAPSFAWSGSSADEVEVPSFVPAEPLRDPVDDEADLSDTPSGAFEALDVPEQEHGDEPGAGGASRPIAPEPPADLSSPVIETDREEDLEGGEPTIAETEFLPPVGHEADDEAPMGMREPEPLEEEPPPEEAVVEPLAQDRVEPPPPETPTVEATPDDLDEPEAAEPLAVEPPPHELAEPEPEPVEPRAVEALPPDLGQFDPDPELGLEETAPRESVSYEPEVFEPVPPERVSMDPDLTTELSDPGPMAPEPPLADPDEPLGERIDPVPIEPEPIIERVRSNPVDPVEAEAPLPPEAEPPYDDPSLALDRDHELPPEEDPSPFPAGALTEDPPPLEPAPEDRDPFPTTTARTGPEPVVPDPPLPGGDPAAEQGQPPVAPHDEPLESDPGPLTEAWSIHDEPLERDAPPLAGTWSIHDEPLESDPGPLTEAWSIHDEPQLEGPPPYDDPAFAGASLEDELVIEPPPDVEEGLEDPFGRPAEELGVHGDDAHSEPVEAFPAEPPAREQPPAARGFFEETEEHETLWREERPDPDPDFEN